MRRRAKNWEEFRYALETEIWLSQMAQKAWQEQDKEMAQELARIADRLKELFQMPEVHGR